MARWNSFEPEPSNLGEPEPMRDAWDQLLKAQAEVELEAGEIETS